MNTASSYRWRMLWVLPPIAIGIAVLVFMVGNRQPPAAAERSETSQPVRVVDAQKLDLIPVAEGYGEVRPEKVWAAVAQVAGRVVETFPSLRNGEVVTAGTLLFRIDPVDYELQVAEAKAQLAELEVQAQNALASLEINRRNLRLAEREKDRIARLTEQGTASRSDVDNAERSMLDARTAVQNSENTLALIPTQRRLLEARLAQAERDLANTEVKAPFDLRIADLAVEKDQYVGIGQTLFSGDAIGRVEITAQVAMSSLRNLLIDLNHPIPSIAEMDTRLATFTGFRPQIRMDMGNHIAEWDAEFVRFSDEVDPQTRTIGVVIAVDDPLSQAIPGQRPLLSKGMFVQVLIRGHTQADRTVLPRSALRGGKVYVINAEQRLEIRPIEILFHQQSISVVADGVAAGEQVVLSDLIPANPGMLLEPVDDQAALTQMLTDAGSAP